MGKDIHRIEDMVIECVLGDDNNNDNSSFGFLFEFITTY